ncbi:MAG: hypothetical protein AB1489_03535 [Acidobacteriota bacterium]
MINWYYQPNFCCDCGERIDLVRSWRRIFSASIFCQSCAKRLINYRRGRLLFPILLCCTSYLLGGVNWQQSKRESLPPAETAVERRLVTATGNNLPLNADNLICGAPTRSGKKCQRHVKVAGYCWQHRRKK